MTANSVNNLRARLADLEAAVDRAADAVDAAQSAYTAGINGEAETGERTGADTARSALDAARREHARAVELRDAAAALLAAAMKRQREAEQAAAREQIETGLAAMASEARDLDTAFAALAGRLVRLRDREGELHRLAHRHFRAPWSAPATMAAARSLSTFLLAMANGNPQPAKGWTAEAVASGAFAIKATFDE